MEKLTESGEALLAKAFRVVSSCKTEDQLTVAGRYSALVRKRLYATESPVISFRSVVQLADHTGG